MTAVFSFNDTNPPGNYIRSYKNYYRINKLDYYRQNKLLNLTACVLEAQRDARLKKLTARLKNESCTSKMTLPLNKFT